MTTQELSQKKWVFLPLDKDLQTKIANSLRISPILSQILINRGITDTESAKTFLQSRLTSLSDPMLLPDIEKSSKRILEAISKNEKITVYGDYDVDGISATALMVKCLEILHKLHGKTKSNEISNTKTGLSEQECPDPNVGYYIPDRMEEGYGLNAKAIEELSRTGTKVIITVDCGVNSFKEARIAKENGIDLIITDHHEPDPCTQLPTRNPPDHVVQADRSSGQLSDEQTDICEQPFEGAFSLINPKLSTSAYPFKELSGAGIAFMLAWALGQSASNLSQPDPAPPEGSRAGERRLPERHSQAGSRAGKAVLAGGHAARAGNKKVSNEFKDFLMDAMGLAALGTIADVVPLQRENRILAKYGLSALQNSENPGIKALKEVTGLKDKVLKSYHIGFCLGPRINAVGRVGNARIGVEMLTVKCEEKAKELAKYMENENKKRQKIQSSILESARNKILSDVDINSALAIVISDNNWHQGVIGIVASRLAGEFYRPVIVIAIEDEIGHGSARSIPNFHIHNAIAKCQEYFPGRKMLISFGGHAQAAGFRILKKDISEFKEIFNKITSEQMNKEDLNPTLNLDAEIKLSSISKPLSEELNRLGPHGEGNAIPVFAARGVKVVGQIRRFGVNGKHLSFYVRQGDVSFKAVAFGMGEKSEMLKKVSENCSIAFVVRDTLQTNNFQTSGYYNRGMFKENLELEIKDIST